jgi:adenylate cyclase class 2
MTEIEIKAHVADPAETEKAILKIAAFEKETEKKDTYWKSGAAGDGKSVKVRFREEGNQTIVTYKRKELRGQMEVNDEQEFSISDRAPFEALLADLGLAPYITKNKKTRSFRHTAPGGTGVTIELSLLEGLGYFIELEILAENPGEEELERARMTLRETLALCGSGEDAVESRFYTELLSSARECQDPKK